MIAWLQPGDPFPPVQEALTEPNGLLAASAHLDAATLRLAYAEGIFPWYGPGDPVLWWSPHPRMVLYTSQFRVSRSLRKTLRHIRLDPRWDVTIDRDFSGVMQACAAPRPGQRGTWIGKDIVQAYTELHDQGHAHSVEVRFDGLLLGGAYGVSLGTMFYGESMFSKAPDASKIALATLVSVLVQEGVPMIDCQQNTRHLASLGAQEIDRPRFVQHLHSHTGKPDIHWAQYRQKPLTPLLDFYLTDKTGGTP